MATYVIGDLQGCFDALLKLLEKISFNERQDKLWFTGDLVNRGPNSLETLRFVYQLGESALSVLGNHDLMLLAVAKGALKTKHNCQALLEASDKEELLAWLSRCPLLYHDVKFNTVLVHAGILPGWPLSLAKQLALEAQAVLQGPKVIEYYQHMYGNKPDRWSNTLTGWERLRFILNVFTRMRFCDATGLLDLESTGDVDTAPSGFKPWFEWPNTSLKNTKILFGHWSTLALSHPIDTQSNFIPLDTGCVWGRDLTALRLEDNQLFQITCKQKD